MPITVYVLKGVSSRKRYIGITNNLTRRIREHALGSTAAGRIIGDLELIQQEEFPNYTSAREREKFLKSGQGRKWLDKLEAASPPSIEN